MPNNNIGILWHFSKIDNLERAITDALNSWNRHKDTREIVPDYIVFNQNQILSESIVKFIQENKLDIVLRKSVQVNHFVIEGKLY